MFRAPVWEVVGSEFSKSDRHSADGISIRFPRVTKIRGKIRGSHVCHLKNNTSSLCYKLKNVILIRMTDDKDYKTHTNLVELKALVASSKEGTDMSKAKKGKAGGKTTGPK